MLFGVSKISFFYEIWILGNFWGMIVWIEYKLGTYRVLINDFMAHSKLNKVFTISNKSNNLQNVIGNCLSKGRKSS